jgi:hypothetical protein
MKKNNLLNIIITIIIILIVLFIIDKYYVKKNEGFIAAHAASHSAARSTNNSKLTTTTPIASTNNTTTTTSSSSSSKDSSCFSKDTLLELETGNTIKINEAKIGDKVLSYSLSKNKLIYSPIIAIPHEENNISTQFIEIKTLSGKSIKMTDCHLIPLLKNDKRKFELLKASDIEINDIIITLDGNEIITSKEIINENGIYTVVTREDYIVVNNIIASPFAVSHLLPNFYYNIHKIIYNINPKLLETTIFNKFDKTNIKFFNNIYKLYKETITV